MGCNPVSNGEQTSDSPPRSENPRLVGGGSGGPLLPPPKKTATWAKAKNGGGHDGGTYDMGGRADPVRRAVPQRSVKSRIADGRRRLRGRADYLFLSLSLGASRHQRQLSTVRLTE